MADTRPDIILPANTKVNIYTALNAQGGFPAVTIGDAISVVNKGNSVILLTTKATEPVAGDGSVPLKQGDSMTNVTPSNGEFAESIATDGLINVRVV